MSSCVIRPMEPGDLDAFGTGFLEQGWTPRPEVWNKYLREQASGARQVFVAEWEGHAAGYLTLVPEAQAGPFAGKGWPEIVDFNVLEKYQRHGIGGALMDAAEQAAAQTSPVVTLGVGLHRGYGPAQRMYVKRGYIPDGSGVWYQNKPATPYGPCVNDDDLVLYLSKSLSR